MMAEENGFNHSKVLYHFDSPWVLLFCSSGCSCEGGRKKAGGNCLMMVVLVWAHTWLGL